GARAGIDGGGTEVERAGDAVGTPVRQGELYLRLAAARRDDMARLLLARQLLDLCRRLVEVDVDRVELVDGGQQCRGTLTDQCTLRHLLLTRDARDRRGDVGVAEIDARGFHVRRGLFDGGGGGARGGLVGVELLLRDEVARDQVAIALSVGVSVGSVCPSLCESGDSRIERCPVGRRIDLEERLSRLYQRA